jgi:N-acetylated-alpha-linked acidic dipeptidase
MKALRVLGVACACTALLASAPPHTTIYGFTAVSSDREFALEDRFLDIPTADGALESAAVVSAHPHYAGSDGDYKLAYYVRDRFKDYGLDTSIEMLTARIDTPRKLSLELISTGLRPLPVPPGTPLLERRRRRREAIAKQAAANPGVKTSPADGFDLRELPIASDPDTANPAVGLPFLAGSADGDVTAPLVYAGHGQPADYAALAAHSINVKGAVLLMRYSTGESRGAEVRRAQARGAAGAVLYDDPADDGYGRGAAYPSGPWRPINSIQRGSLGDGITIPALPISASNAQSLLAAIHGPTAPAPWTGAMSVTYPFARGPATVRIVVVLNRKTTTLWNTIGVLHGTLPGQSIVIGARRDAWVYGIGSNGGIITLLETARGLGNLLLTGWQPGRTIVLAAWDGEEFGAYGSLAYLKRHGDELRDGSIAYLNTEPGVTGSAFGADAVAAIAPTIADSTHIVPDPAQPGNTIYDRWAFRTHGAMPPVVHPAGGFDRDAFLFAAGTPSASAGFSGPFGVYHSSYDTLLFATTISDPGFGLHRAAAQLYGIAALRLANADVVPYHFSAYVGPMQSAVRALAALARVRKMTLDSRGFSRSIGRYAGSAARSDLATTRALTAGASGRELEAARVLDLIAYGIDGGTGITFPDVDRALRNGDQAAADLAVARARTSIERAATLIVH